MAGHRGLVGSAIVRRLREAGFESLLSATRREVDLRDQAVAVAARRSGARKFRQARAAGAQCVEIRGSGTPPREFLRVKDLADARLFLPRDDSDDEHVDVGTGEDLTIRELDGRIRDVVAPGVELTFDVTRPDALRRRRLHVSRLRALRRRHRVGLREGSEATCRWYVDARRRDAVRDVAGTAESVVR